VGGSWVSGVSRALPAAAFLLLASTALAGCAGEGGHEDAAAAVPEGLEVLHGIVVDLAIRPLGHVRLSTQGPGGMLWTNTSAAGSFAFPPLPPGTYLVSAHLAGFADTRASAVLDGTDRTVRIQLEPDARTLVYAAAHLFRGFLECSMTSVGATVAVCYGPNIATQQVGETTCDSGLPTPCLRPANATQDHHFGSLQLDGSPLWVQHETVWTSTQALGDQLHVFTDARTGSDGNRTEDSLNDTAGPSPLLTVEDTAALEKAGVGPGSLIGFDVFAGGMPSSGSQVCDPVSGGCFWDTGMTLEQDFTIYSHVFYGFVPPPGYRFSSDGEPVPPQP
jgi:hypothetical protein